MRTVALLWLAAVVIGQRGHARPRRPSLRDRSVSSPAPPKDRRVAHRAAWTAAALVLIGGAVYLGHDYRLDREQRDAAVALTSGDPDRAPDLIAFYGCGGCHTIPGVPGAKGLVGPPLAQLGRRVYIAGVLTNTPDHLVQWIVDPRRIDPQTAMPVTGITPEEARHVAAFLYSAR